MREQDATAAPDRAGGRLASGAGARFLYISGKPLGEPIAWRGPIVMNTREELKTAWRELDEGTFVKHEAKGKRG